MALEARWIGVIVALAAVVLCCCVLLGFACRVHRHPRVVDWWVRHVYRGGIDLLACCYIPCCWRRRGDNATRLRYVDVARCTTAFVRDEAALPPPPPPPLSKPPATTTMRVVSVSDTHLRHTQLTIPHADVLVHSGDMLLLDRATPAAGPQGDASERALATVNDWFRALRTPCTATGDARPRIGTACVCVAGNHDKVCAARPLATVRSLLADAQYLQNSAVFIPAPAAAAAAGYQPPAPAPNGADAKSANGNDHESDGGRYAYGIVVLGLPHSRRGASGNVAFQFARADGPPLSYRALNKPHSPAAVAARACGVDVLLTHDQAYGHGGWDQGCRALRAVVDGVLPRVHCCGHVHGMYSVCFERAYPTLDGDGRAVDVKRDADAAADAGVSAVGPGGTVGINACSVNSVVLPVHVPVVFDVPVRRVDLHALRDLNAALALATGQQQPPADAAAVAAAAGVGAVGPATASTPLVSAAARG